MAKPKNTNDLIDAYSKINNEIDIYLKKNAGILSNEQQRSLIAEQIANQHKLINELQKLYLNGEVDALDKINEVRSETEKLVNEEKRILDIINKSNKSRELTKKIVNDIGKILITSWKTLQEQDKIIKSTVLNLGLSGAKAVMIRNAFEGSAAHVARLGGDIGDIKIIMESFAEETGRARSLSADMVKDITNIGRGTGLGVEQAAKLGAQFELMGVSAKGAMDYVQGVVDNSERMGVNTTKVLKSISDNFKKLQTFNFQQGVKGFSEMAMYAEKFKIDITDALNAADTARTLEGAINMVAQLQVMGGEFAKLDMFETLYFSRNDPAKFQAKIAEMTKGIVTLRRNSDGTFEKFISPADRDRLAFAGKALGITSDKMTEMALRAFDIGKMSDQLAGMGLTDREKELIQGAAFMNDKTGRFQVLLGEHMVDISNLTAQQAKSFASEQELLEDRAKHALTFDETFKATINMLKTALLPLLNNINKVLDVTLKPLADMATEGWSGMAKAGGILLAAGGLWKFVTGSLSSTVSQLSKVASKKILGDKLDSVIGSSPSSSPSKGWQFTKTGTIRKGAPELTKAQGMKSLGTGAGVGAAALGVGAGIGLAAAGISQLADSMSKLNDKQAQTLSDIVTSLGWFVLGGVAAAAGIIALGKASELSAAGLGIFALTALGVGAGIGLAATGIGFMGKGLAELVMASKDAGTAMLDVGKGIGAISLAMAGFALGGGLGLLAFAGTMKTISNHADSIERVGRSFESIRAVMSGSKEDFIAVENAVKSISNMNTSKGGMLTELANLLKSPLKVEFADNSLTIRNNITLELDGQKILDKSLDGKLLIRKHIETQHGRNKPS